MRHLIGVTGAALFLIVALFEIFPQLNSWQFQIKHPNNQILFAQVDTKKCEESIRKARRIFLPDHLIIKCPFTYQFDTKSFSGLMRDDISTGFLFKKQKANIYYQSLQNEQQMVLIDQDEPEINLFILNLGFINRVFSYSLGVLVHFVIIGGLMLIILINKQK